MLKYKIRCIKFLSILTLIISTSAFAVDTDADTYEDAVDAFPNDASEWVDTDGDNIGNNSDPDIDGDGLLNNVDPDDDGDGAPDSNDPLPLDHREWLDTDNDGTGNNTDTDDDGDGVPDLLDVFPLNPLESLDSDNDGIGNIADADDDTNYATGVGDGVLDAYDAFPLDPLETIDTDHDGIGNNADLDDDGDGVNDGDDAFPLDFNVNADLDGDGVGNSQDPDIDNDGIVNTLDDFPYDINEWFDTDGDSIGNNTDTDDDTHDGTGVGDGVLDVDDDLPLDASETIDTDNDGIGNNADDDDDDDGVQDGLDKCPLDPLERLDTDNDGICDGPDLDADGDGEPDASDAFPLDSAEKFDQDGDGIGDNSDADIDGDGITNINDDFDFDSGEYVDTDGDGIGNNTDTDDDTHAVTGVGDGVADTADIFPLDGTEWEDTDGDGIGNNSDVDIDNDGLSNSLPPDPVNDSDNLPYDLLENRDPDGDGIGNNADTDDDTHAVTGVGDGVLDCTGNNLPCDVFPENPLEWEDYDGDGVGNNADPDDDNDGHPDFDVNGIALDAFPFDSSEWLDTDNDGKGNDIADDDDDNDGVLDTDDAYPLNANEQYDFDGDGVGDNSDSDDDNDGFTDAVDAFDNDPLEWFDTDNDGTGNNEDTDDDGDTYEDELDLFPLDKTEWFDADGDGLGDNADADDDNDGIRDVDDAFPNNPVEGIDTDGDGLGNIFDNDDDNDGFYDFEDKLPLNPNEHLDTDGDLIGNNEDLDDDADGMSDEFEITHNFDPLDPDDAELDTDLDGITNHEEALAGTNPLFDDYAPIITPPQAVHINAEHTFTKLEISRLISLTSISVNDGLDGKDCCGLTALGFETGAKNVSSGLVPILWRAVDNAGNIATTSQVLNIHPLVNFYDTQIVAEGGVARVKVVLSGDAPAYPVTLPLTISGSIDTADYTMTDNNIVIAQGTSGFIDINLNEDFQLEGDEKLIVSFEEEVNSGVHAEHIITVSENNVAPSINLTIWQKGIPVPSVAVNDGEVTIVLNIQDSNVGDTHKIDWDIPDYLNAVLSSDELQWVFPVENVSVPDENKGLINISVMVTDSGNTTNSGSAELSQTKQVFIPLLATQQTLRTLDTDRDGISDIDEGFSDDDLDGLPAYMDNSTISYLQPLHVNSAIVKLAETEPGLELRLGKFALLQSSDGVQLTEEEIVNTGLVEQDSLVNTSGYFDFEIHNIMPFGSSVAIVLPLENVIAEYSVYRKVNEQLQWADFVEDSNNVIATSLSINGVCPPPHSELYQVGLNVGDNCLKLLIEDGGVNDADGIENGVIDDPGGIAEIDNYTISLGVTPKASSSGSFSFFALLSLVLMFLSRTRRSF